MPRYRRDPIYKETGQDKSKPKVLGVDGKLHWQRRELPGYYVRWTDASGKSRKVYAAPTRSQAMDVYQQKMKEVADERAGIRRADMSRYRIRELLDSFLAARKSRITEKQYRELASALRRAIKSMKAVSVADVTRTRVERYLNRLDEAGLAPRTVNLHLGHLKALFNWAVESEIMWSSRIASIKPRPVHEARRKRRPLSRDETQRLFEAATRPDARPWELVSYALAYYAGLRREEIRLVRWTDVDLEERTLTIRPEIDKSRRGAVLPLCPRLAEMLAEHRQRFPAMPTASVSRLPYKPLHCFYKTLKAAGIERVDASGKVVDFHALRHTYGTHLIQAGADPKTVQVLMRHAKAETTLGIYVHSDRQRMKDAVARLPDFAGSAEMVEKEATNNLWTGMDNNPRTGARSGTLNGRPNPVRFGADRRDLPRPAGDGQDHKTMPPGLQVQAVKAVRDYIEMVTSEKLAGRKGLEPSTFGSTVRRSIQVELTPRLKYSATYSTERGCQAPLPGGTARQPQIHTDERRSQAEEAISVHLR